MAPVVAGSIPVTHPTFFPIMFGSLAQLAEHLTLNQGVTGSIPVRSTIFLPHARVVELVDTRDSKSRFARSASSILARGTNKKQKNE